MPYILETGALLMLFAIILVLFGNMWHYVGNVWQYVICNYLAILSTIRQLFCNIFLYFGQFLQSSHNALTNFPFIPSLYFDPKNRIS